MKSGQRDCLLTGHPASQ